MKVVDGGYLNGTTSWLRI